MPPERNGVKAGILKSTQVFIYLPESAVKRSGSDFYVYAKPITITMALRLALIHTGVSWLRSGFYYTVTDGVTVLFASQTDIAADRAL